MYEENDNVVVKAAIPGAKAEDIDVSINGDVLTIKGETKSSEEIEEENYIYREQRYGSFSRSVGLPANVNTEDAEADFEDGILTLTMPKLEEAKPRQISVKSKGEDE
jgi:HSP20 family protein